MYCVNMPPSSLYRSKIAIFLFFLQIAAILLIFIFAALRFLCVLVVPFYNSRKVNARRADRQRDLATANRTINRRKAYRRFRQHIRHRTRFFRRVDVFPLRCEAIAANAAFCLFLAEHN